MKKNSTRLFVFMIILALFSSNLKAQGRFDVGLDLKNMHYWRGLRVSDGFVTTPTIGYYNSGFSFFSWGGLSLDGQYKEVTQIISYSTGDFSLTLIDIFNFSGAHDASYLNFNSDETIHILDLALAYNFGEKAPLRIMLASIFYGNDRDNLGNNRYSTYLEAGFPLVKDDYTVEPFAALGFAFSGEDDNSLYGRNQFDLVNIGLAVSKIVTMGNYQLPVTGRLGINPSLKQASVEIALGLF